ncbi:14404_t:CDS:1, partial [Cetraspora pellucida]
MLNNLCENVAIDKLNQCLAKMPRFPELKVFKKGLENIKYSTANEFHNIMKVFLFVIKEIIIKYHKISIEKNIAKQYDSELIN